MVITCSIHHFTFKYDFSLYLNALFGYTFLQILSKALFKRVNTLIHSVIMAVMTFSPTTVFAADNTPKNFENANKNIETVSARSYETVNMTERLSITLTQPAAGATFLGAASKFRIRVTFSPSGGNTILAVRLHNYTTGGTFLQEWQSSNGIIDVTVDNTGMLYQLEYLLASGSGTVTVNTTVYNVIP